MTTDDAEPGMLPAAADLESPAPLDAPAAPDAPGAAPDAPAAAATPAAPAPARRTAIWAIPIVFLFGLWLELAFSSGGYVQSQWLLPGIALALFALVIGVVSGYPRRPGQLSMVVLALFGLYAVWVMASALWASSLNNVWDESGRTLLYLLVVTLALIFFTDAGARRAARYLLLAGAVVLVGFTVYRIHGMGAEIGGLEQLFVENRFTYPVSYPNNDAALFLMLLWPLLWVAADPREWVPVRGLSLATCWGLVALAILTQSRGGFWATAITLVLLFVLSPARLRTLLYLLVPAGLTVWGFPALNSYWRLGPEKVAGGVAVRVILVGMAVAAVVGLALALLERWIQVSRRMTIVLGAGVLVAVVGSAIYGAVLLERQVGDPVQWLSDSWSRFTADQITAIPGSGSTNSQGESAATSRFLVMSGSGRWDIWRVAWGDFRGSPWLGVGAGNYVFTYDRNRHRDTAFPPRQPHSWELQVLSETGAVGGVLFVGVLLLGLGGMLWPRFRAGWAGLRRNAQPNRLLKSDASPSGRDGQAGDQDAGSARSSATRATEDAVSRRPVRSGGQGFDLQQPASRWGADPRLYAWETMLAVGVLYWLVHGSAEWLWNMPGASLPAVLMLALGVASIDARAGVLWPRLHDWMAGWLTARTGSQATPSDATDLPESAATPAPGFAAAAIAPLEERAFMIVRRADRHAEQRRRRESREARRERRDLSLVPPGRISLWFRRALVATAAVALVGLALPYLSLRLQDSALSMSGTNDRAALRSARFAARLQPADPQPLLTEADIYRFAAEDSSGQSALDGLALSLDAHIRAIERDPAGWALYYRAGMAVLWLLEASTGAPQGSLTGVTPAAEGGGGEPSLGTPQTQTRAQRLLAIAPEELRLLARSYFVEAQQRNPLNQQVQTALETTDKAALTSAKAGGS